LAIRHADTLICLQWYVLVLTLRLVVYTLFGKNNIKFGQKFFASPKIATPVHPWSEAHLKEFANAYSIREKD